MDKSDHVFAVCLAGWLFFLLICLQGSGPNVEEKIVFSVVYMLMRSHKPYSRLASSVRDHR